MQYESTRESIQKHPVPGWYDDAKLGIFIHWGLYSVPAWAPLTGELGEVIAKEGWTAWFAKNPYAEWYMNSIRIKGSPSHRYHVETYSEDFSYFDFVPLFNEATQGWDPQPWADLFHQVGARYVVLTTKHHDGFLLWPSRQPNPKIEGYFSRRDLVGELTHAVRARGMRMALYYSGGLDWTFNDTVIRDIRDIPAAVPQGADYVKYANNHWLELIEHYEPSILWNDIAYPAGTDLNELFAHYYNHVPEGLVNDRFIQRFGSEEQEIEDVAAFFERGLFHFDFRTPEYASFEEITEIKWEATRGIGYSFGYNRNEGLENYLSVQELVRSFVDIVSKNGNLLLNVGPTADGTIPPMQRERLLGLGQWLGANGEAIFDTRPWVTAEGSTDGGIAVRFTQKEDSLYTILLGTPQGNRVGIEGLRAEESSTIYLLGTGIPLTWKQEGDNLSIILPAALPQSPAHALKITPQPRKV